jgi:hypothetical protein
VSLPSAVRHARNEHTLGNQIIVSVSFVDADSGDPADPTTVILKMRATGGAEQEYVHGVDSEIINDGVGEYHATIEPDREGLWRWYWIATGTIVAATEGSFRVTLDYE